MDLTPYLSQQAPKGVLKDRRPSPWVCPGLQCPSASPPWHHYLWNLSWAHRKDPGFVWKLEVRQGWGAGCTWLAPAGPRAHPPRLPHWALSWPGTLAAAAAAQTFPSALKWG